jgi:hypothetical protein
MKTISKKEIQDLDKQIAANANLSRKERTLKRDAQIRSEADALYKKYKWASEFIIKKLACKHILAEGTVEKIINQRASYRRTYAKPKPAKV